MDISSPFESAPSDVSVPQPVACDEGQPDIGHLVERLNRELQGASASAIVKRTLARARRPVLTTRFGPNSAALIRMVHEAGPDVPVVWIDTGHHTRATHRFVRALVREWDLDLHVFHPLTGEDASGDPVERFEREPIRRALRTLEADVRLTDIRADRGDSHGTRHTVERDPDGVLKVAPLLRWDAARVGQFLHAQDLPNGHDYLDAAASGGDGLRAA